MDAQPIEVSISMFDNVYQQAGETARALVILDRLKEAGIPGRLLTPAETGGYYGTEVEHGKLYRHDDLLKAEVRFTWFPSGMQRH